MADNTKILSGSFVGSGVAEKIVLRGGVDWIKTWNYTVTAAGGAGTGVQFMWRRGMTQDYAFEWQKLAADDSITQVIATSGGFTYIDSTDPNKLGALNSTITAISAAAIPIVSATSTATLIAGDIVKILDVTGAQQFGGIDFQIDTVIANTSFRLVYAPQIVAGTTGSFRPVDLPKEFYPKWRYISKITAANPAVITTTVDHGYVAGQLIRLRVPSEFGMTQMDNLVGTVVSVTDSTITTDINSSAFTAFAWPLTAAGAFTPAQVIPFGESSSNTYIGLTDDATDNRGEIYMSLAAGTDSPAGALNDVIYWEAGKNFSDTNE